MENLSGNLIMRSATLLQHVLNSMKPNGKAAIVLPTGFLMAKSSVEGIRKAPSPHATCCGAGIIPVERSPREFPHAAKSMHAAVKSKSRGFIGKFYGDKFGSSYKDNTIRRRVK